MKFLRLTIGHCIPILTPLLLLPLWSLPAQAQDKESGEPTATTETPTPITITTVVDDRSATAHKDDTDQKLPQWYVSLNERIPIDAILVVVTGLTGWAVWRQAVHTKTAASAANLSAVSADHNLRLVYTPHADIRLVSFTLPENPKEGERRRYVLWLEIKNIGSNVVRFISYRTIYRTARVHGPNWFKRQEVSRGPGQVFDVPIHIENLSPEDIADFENGTLGMAIRVTLEMDDNFGGSISHIYSGHIICGAGQVRWYSRKDFPGGEHNNTDKDD